MLEMFPWLITYVRNMITYAGNVSLAVLVDRYYLHVVESWLKISEQEYNCSADLPSSQTN